MNFGVQRGCHKTGAFVAVVALECFNFILFFVGDKLPPINGTAMRQKKSWHQRGTSLKGLDYVLLKSRIIYFCLLEDNEVRKNLNRNPISTIPFR